MGPIYLGQGPVPGCNSAYDYYYIVIPIMCVYVCV